MMPEMLIILRGLMAASRSVFLTLILLLAIVFFYGIAFTQLSKDLPAESLFRDVPTSMYVLLIHGTLLCNADKKIEEMSESGSLALQALFFVFILKSCILFL